MKFESSKRREKRSVSFKVLCQGKTVEEGLRQVATWNAAFLPSEDLGEALAAFAAKRPPSFTGR